MDVFIARQAILDRKQQLFAYELLFRPCRQNYAGVTDDTASTLQVLSNALLSAGISILSDRTPVFINFGREMLLSSWTSMFPASAAVIEILESVTPDEEVIAACTALKARGYTLALDDVTDRSDPEFFNLADIIKVDFRSTTQEVQARLAREHKRAGRRLLAEKVETAEEFERAKQLGFDLFQGFFFSKPVLMQGRQVAAMKGNALRLLKELGAPDINFKRLEGLIRCDVSLTYKLLRYANSALFARRKPISDVLPALLAVGELEIRRWIVLATLVDLSGKTQVLATHALIRARFCENLAIAAGADSPSDAFIVGMFSLLDALVHRPLPEVLGEMGLPSDIMGTLLGVEAETTNSRVLRLARSYELGNWDGVSGSAKVLDVQDERVAALYVEAVEWASQILGAVGGTAALPSAAGRGIESGVGSMPGSANDLLALRKSLDTGAGTPAVSLPGPLIRGTPY